MNKRELLSWPKSPNRAEDPVEEEGEQINLNMQLIFNLNCAQNIKRTYIKKKV